ncbi:hypothetical protein J4H92_02040 [Leucobacter weissii]|uniref:Uncharacterized protein n=1 Tax=Leucobacter weissii TaxID=1983706 RepID=A0A939MLA5_9MICO|nr:hypothetical protein [Leucobacter weissii]MBO1900727.1 hypothetical protein [Leucobacter weissii]
MTLERSTGRLEGELGYRLPDADADADAELARIRNGGAIERRCYPVDGAPDGIGAVEVSGYRFAEEDAARVGATLRDLHA